jgi:SEC-C motif-containing protein
MPSQKSPACPCGGPDFTTCCGPYISGAALPATAEQLMRSRYSAYTLGNEAYLRATWHPSTLPAEPVVSDDEKLQWLGLEVKSSLRLRQRKVKEGQRAAQGGGTESAPEWKKDAEQDADHDSVEFVARYKVNGRAHRLHEVSRFVREQGRWFYLDGSFPQ